MGNKINKRKNIAVLLIVLFIGIATVIGILAERGLFGHSNSGTSEGKASVSAIIPKPVQYISRDGSFLLTSDMAICVSAGSGEQTEEILSVGEYLAGKLRPATGYPVTIKEASQPEAGSIYLTTVDGDESLGKEGYRLEVTKDNVTLRACTPEGLFRGIQTIRQMLPAEIEKNEAASGINWSIPCAEITDYPTYEWRGMMLDVARHFIKVEDVKRTIDLIAEYKINRFHLHLSDDQGWRIEIKSWPDLAKIGGSTEVGGGEGGFYTQEEYTELVNYAKERYITIIPEIDMPGHVNAALASYGELNPDGVKKELYTGINVGFSSLMCRSEITYQFVNDVIGELAAITPGEYIHIGGDEASQTSEEDYNYFVGRVNEIVKSHGKTAVGWNPIDKSDGIGPEAILQNWSGDADSAKAKKMKIIMSPPDKAYLDMKYYENSPIGLSWAGFTTTEEAYRWDPAMFSIPKEEILGIEGALWSETIESIKDIEYLTFPRLPGLAEIGWTPKDKRNWDEYRQRLQAHGPRMKYLGINYFRDPVVGWTNISK